MEQTLKITNVLSDPTRYYIYQHVTNQHSEVTVQDIAEHFEIHPNVARLHLSKLEDINLLTSETKKTGKGGRPSRLYRISNDVVQLNFPFRDYQLLSKIAMQTMMQLGEPGMTVLYETGKIYGKELIESNAGMIQLNNHSTFEEKLHILRNAATIAGFHPVFEPTEDQSQVHFQIFNCPFKEVAATHPETICKMHSAFLKGMFNSLFDDVELIETGNMLAGCRTCTYQATVTK
ncbi:MAG: helix-turn-helix transcriptional regulator [Bacillus sp. (in: firmicutes)]